MAFNETTALNMIETVFKNSTGLKVTRATQNNLHVFKVMTPKSNFVIGSFSINVEAGNFMIVGSEGCCHPDSFQDVLACVKENISLINRYQGD